MLTVLNRLTLVVPFVFGVDHIVAAKEPVELNSLLDDPGEDVRTSLTCGAARNLLTDRGYRDVRVRSCFTFAYAFTAEKNGQKLRVFVDPSNGRIWEG